MGYSDLGCYGGDINTPNLDALANNGLRFTQFYNSARCCPSRAALMTGLYPHQTGIGYMTNSPKKKDDQDLGLPAYQGRLNQQNVTLAEVLKQSGYKTLMTGKWHLGLNKENWPLQRGFDKFYGLIAGASNYFKPEAPRGITYKNNAISITDEDYYTTDAFTNYAIDFIDESQKEDTEKPFFLYLAYTAPHWPLHAPQKDVEKYKGKYMNGWSKMRKERFAKMKAMGLIDEKWQLSPKDFKPWDALSDEKKTEMDLRRAIYSAMVDRMDQNIGKLLGSLKQKNILDNTIIIFLNDNGACAEGGNLGGGPAEQLETKKGYFLSYGKYWANASNTPYREYKHWVHEGGISTPFIVHWPEGIQKEHQGAIINEYAFLPDVMTTFVDLAQAEYPKAYKGNKIPAMVGKSLKPLFSDTEITIHDEPIFWEHEGNKAIRLGNYKLVSKWSKKKEEQWELYNITTDRTETNNLALKMPKKVSEMEMLYKNWSKENNVLPWHVIKQRLKEKTNQSK